MVFYYVFFILGIPGNLIVLGMVKYNPLNPQEFCRKKFFNSCFISGKLLECISSDEFIRGQFDFVDQSSHQNCTNK